MKKRILSILLALCMVLCLVPTTAFAEGETNRKVETEQELVDALADSSVDIITLKNDIAIGTTLTILRKVTLDLNGYVLKMTGSGSVIILDNKSGITGDLTLIDSNPTAEHKFKVNGVEPWVLDNSGTETVYGGIITGGTGSRIFFSNGVGGGGVIIGSGALTMNGGNIVGCIANEGGGLFLSDGSFTMNAGSIVGCSTPNRLTTGEAFHGGIYAFGPMANGDTTGVITLTGGLIKNNGRYAINAVYKTTIYANGGEVYGEVHLSQACKITCLAEDNGITAFKGKTVIGGTSGVNPSHVDWGLFYGGLYIYGNTTGVIVTYKDGDSEYAKQVLPSGTLATRPDDPTKPGHIFDGWYTSDGAQCDYTTAVTENVTVTARWTLKTQSVSSEQELNDALADISVGKILLTADIDISSSLTVNRKVTLDLNGYVLRYADTTANGSVFKIVSGGDLTVIDSRPDAEHRFNSDNILWAPDEQNGKEIVMGGVITGGTGTPCYVNGSSYFVACGGGVYLEGDARFTMDGGNIVGCIANTGGGVHISENGSFTMNGGSIMGCSSWDLSVPGGTPYFGGVYLDSGTFTMTGGVIKDCAKYSVVLNENATMNANGGEIYGVVEVGKNSYVTGLDGIAGVTVFRDNFWIYHNSARVDWGIFYGSITNYYDDPIIGLTVTYMNGETIYAKQILPSGTLATRPDAPTTTPGYTFIGWDKEIPTTMPAENITLKARWKDIEKPTGEIIIGTNKWQSFLNKLTFGLFFKNTQEVTINATDNSSTVFISYLVTDQDLSEAELGSLVYQAYDEPFCIDPNGEHIIYAMLVDESLNITYLRSDRITLDNIQPLIGGIENGKIYCAAQTVSIDEKYVNTVTVNGTAVELDENNSFSLDPADGEQQIIVTDKAGNTAEMTVTVNDGHTFGEWVSNGNGTHTRKCTVDGCNGFETEDCTGGNATCTEKAICELCGKAYGEFNASNHTDLRHTEAKAATESGEGNIEYWHCNGCGNYYSDAAGTKKIKQADTVTARLKSNSKSPQTGHTGNLALLEALMFTGSGAALGLTAAGKKKKRNK